MPRYFLHLYDDLDVADEEGSDLPDLEAARKKALMNARALAAADVAKGYLKLRHRIDIESETGEVLATVTFKEAVTIEE